MIDCIEATLVAIDLAGYLHPGTCTLTRSEERQGAGIGKFATDTIWANSKTLRRNVASQIYSHKCGFNAAYHLEIANVENVGYILREFVSDYGAPEHLTFDGAAV